MDALRSLGTVSVGGILGFVSYLVSSYSIPIPPDCKPFHIIAGGGAMAGLAIGRIALPQLRDTTKFIVVTLLATAACAGALLLYLSRVQQGSADFSDLVFLAFLLAAAFFAFAFLMPFAGVTFSGFDNDLAATTPRRRRPRR